MSALNPSSLQDNATLIAETAEKMALALREGRKVLFFGNGGSAADAQHIAAEFVGRFIPDRMPLPAISLATDTSALTALGNDYGYNAVFSRQIQALGNAGDIAIGISTSGNSPNVLEAFDARTSPSSGMPALPGLSNVVPFGPGRRNCRWL